ncbi:MAG TPA: type II toxin-antitoxin system VapC family toxin [Rudaea sp.]|jgi:predicted nucleic-acid-binding protein|nr:type II toxin-antitoxin system VapC family toxin [Rudaea sp.]
MIGLDTNVLARYITQDDERQGRLAKRFLETQLTAETPGFVNHVVLCELVWVFETAYDYSREQIMQTLQRLFESAFVRFESSQIVWRALNMYRQGQGFADAMLVLINESRGCDFTLTFDKRAAKMKAARLLADQ